MRNLPVRGKLEIKFPVENKRNRGNHGISVLNKAHHSCTFCRLFQFHFPLFHPHLQLLYHISSIELHHLEQEKLQSNYLPSSEYHVHTTQSSINVFILNPLFLSKLIPEWMLLFENVYLCEG